MSGVMAEILVGILAAMIVAAAIWDLRTRTIPNGLNAAIALLAIPFWWASGTVLWPDMVLHIAIAAAVLGLFAVAFAFGAMGGGDVKMVAALVLWLPPTAVIVMLVTRHGRAASSLQGRAPARNSIWSRDRRRRFVADWRTVSLPICMMSGAGLSPGPTGGDWRHGC
jgi:hypothetical protein